MADGFVGRYEVVEDRVSRRRTWPLEAKRQIVAESHAPGATVSAVARRHRLMPSQVTTWRLHPAGKLGASSAKVSPAFVPLMPMEPGAETPRPAAGPETVPVERIEIEAGGGVVIRLSPSTPAGRIAEIAAALRRTAW